MMSASSVCAQTVMINKKPLIDFAEAVKEKIEKKEVDLAAPFSVELSGEISKDGKLDVKKSKFIKAQGNSQIVNLAKIGIEAVNDTNVLSYLSQAGLKTIHLKVSQDEKNLSSTIRSLTTSENQAKKSASALNAAIEYAKQQLIVRKSRATVNESLFLNGSKVTSNGKEVIISIETPAEEIRQLIKEYAGQNVR